MDDFFLPPPKKKKRKLPAALKKNLWKKGQSGNPRGAQLHDPIKRQLKNLTEAEMIEVGSLVVQGNVEELERIANDKTESVLKCMLAAVAMRTINLGDPQALEILLNRLIGKVKDKVEYSGQTTLNANFRIITDSEVRLRLAKIREDV